jgi:methylmalonyl-CoA/ethylmalonyl-CoA epimerase
VLQDMSHIGIVVNDLEAALELWTGVFGYVEVERQRVELEGVRNAFVSIGTPRGAGACIELMEPLDKSDMSNPIARRLAENGEGIFHVAIFAEDPSTASRELKDAGLTVIDRPPVWEGEKARAIVHPKSANGVLLEIYTRP